MLLSPMFIVIQYRSEELFSASSIPNAQSRFAPQEIAQSILQFNKHEELEVCVCLWALYVRSLIVTFESSRVSLFLLTSRCSNLENILRTTTTNERAT